MRILANAWNIATTRSHGLTHQQLESVFTHSGPLAASSERQLWVDSGHWRQAAFDPLLPFTIGWNRPRGAIRENPLLILSR